MIFTLAYNRASFCERAMALAPREGFERYVFDLCYPLERDQDAMRAAADRSGFEYHRLENRSVSRNWNAVADLLKLEHGDIMIGLDPDSRPVTPGWARAIVDVFEADPSVAMVTMDARTMREPHHMAIPFRLETIGGHLCRVYERLTAWPLMSFDVGFMRDVGGLGEWNAVYGFTEHWVAERLGSRRWVMLHEFFDDTETATDPEYEAWKQANRAGEFNSTFEAWLARAWT